MTATADKPKPAKKKNPKLNSYPFWSPRFWHGMRVGDWLGLLARNGFRINPLRLTMALEISGFSVFNSTMYFMQQMLWGRRIEETLIEQPPIFIIGHWRTGTTHLHELMCCDDRLAYPTTYECFVPYHFLLTGKIVPKMFWFTMPSKRPMDNMLMGFDRPQEDEFALCAMGAPTPYLRMAFPNHPPVCQEFLDMEGISEKDMNKWESSLLWFVKALTLHKQKRMILKSSPHTGRIEVLARLFPGAKFIHLVRDPYSIFPSTRRLWYALDKTQGLQHPKNKYLDEYVFSCFERMYAGFEKQREKIDPAQICDIRYEELVQDPIGQVESIYEKLNLGDFEHFREKLETYVGKLKDYKPNRHELEPEIKQQIADRWGNYFRRYDYDT